MDRWETVNSDDDESLPASVTWYDAMAFVRSVRKKKGLPVRLLSEAEYDQLARPTIDPPAVGDGELLNTEQQLGRFYTPDNRPIDGHPPRMKEEDFQALHFRFIPEALNWKTSESGIRFLVSPHFGEWLDQEGAAVNTLTLTSLCCHYLSPCRGMFSPTSTGKYKSKKIGFRLCYHCEK